MYINDRLQWRKCRVELTNKTHMGRGGEDWIPSREDLWQNVQNRDCAYCLVSCLNCTVSLIYAFILNSPSTSNCPITAPTLTDQSKPVPKSNPIQIQTPEVSLPTDTLILSSSSLSSITSTSVELGRPAEVRLPVHAPCRDSETEDIPPVCPASHTGVRALSQGCHTHSLSLPSSPGAMPRTPVHWGQWKFSSWLEGLPPSSSGGAGKRSQVGETLTNTGLTLLPKSAASPSKNHPSLASLSPLLHHFLSILLHICTIT